MESLVTWFTNNLSQYVSREVVVFIISLMPILELRGGLLAASLLKVPMLTAIPICVTGNIIPIPFILLLIKKVFAIMKKWTPTGKFVERIEAHAMKRSGRIANAEFLGLMLFVGIPLPGTGAWTGSLIASLLDVDIKKAVVAEFIGVVIACIIMCIVSYGLLGAIIS
ncbi:MAG: small multi-drug export protein [Lachnospiraceae bacterium]|nr:small multi-drug export protein [Lachnospiraceae bacterium]